MPKIEVLVGMIGSGKSTYARKRADEGALVVCHDDLAEMVHAGGPTPSGRGYDPALRDCYRKMEESIVRVALECGRDVIVDRTHLTRESRSRWIGFAKWPSFAEWDEPPVVAVTFPIESSEVHARRRFESDPRGRSCEAWLGVARHHAEQARAEPLSDSEGFAEVREVKQPRGE